MTIPERRMKLRREKINALAAVIGSVEQMLSRPNPIACPRELRKIADALRHRHRNLFRRHRADLELKPVPKGAA